MISHCSKHNRVTDMSTSCECKPPIVHEHADYPEAVACAFGLIEKVSESFRKVFSE